jgi:hypothetical protein
MEGFWAFFWLAVVLKIPIVALLWIVWWAIHAEPETESADDGGGSDRHGHGPRVKPPRPPRRGPHGDPVPPAPERVRANGRSLTLR